LYVIVNNDERIGGGRRVEGRFDACSRCIAD
jgi:hypothetical protein